MVSDRPGDAWGTFNPATNANIFLINRTSDATLFDQHCPIDLVVVANR